MAKRNMSPLITLPLLSNEELDTILLGLCHIELDEDSDLAPVAEALIERIVATLPPPGSAGKSQSKPRLAASSSNLSLEIHAAVQNELRLHIEYSDRKGADSRRIIWPIELYASNEEDGLVVAWCETRNDFRNFRTDRIRSMETLERYPIRRQLLLARWAVQQQDDFY